MSQFEITYRCIEKSLYQVFIQNVSSEGDFIRVAWGVDINVAGYRRCHVDTVQIFSPTKRGGEPIYICTWDPSICKLWIAFDVVQRSRKREVIGHYISRNPSLKSLRKTIGSVIYADIQDRKITEPVRAYVGRVRSNMKKDYKLLSDSFARAYDLLTQQQQFAIMMGEAEIKGPFLNEMARIESYLKVYNEGARIDDLVVESRLQYEFFLQDFKLSEPTGVEQDPPLTMNDLYVNNIYKMREQQ